MVTNPSTPDRLVCCVDDVTRISKWTSLGRWSFGNCVNIMWRWWMSDLWRMQIEVDWSRQLKLRIGSPRWQSDYVQWCSHWLQSVPEPRNSLRRSKPKRCDENHFEAHWDFWVNPSIPPPPKKTVETDLVAALTKFPAFKFLICMVISKLWLAFMVERFTGLVNFPTGMLFWLTI